MRIEFIQARDMPDAWFQCVYHIFEKGYEYTIDRGSFRGHKRIEYDYIAVNITILAQAFHSRYPSWMQCSSSYFNGIRRTVSGKTDYFDEGS
ncbi:MAG: hypothetical protein ABSB22_20290 [Thermodesulfobacteriota bacterium]